MAAIDDLEFVKGKDLPTAVSMGAGDFMVVVVDGKTSKITYEQISAILTGDSITPDQIRDKLATLSGTDRLDASAIKNLPSGGGSSGFVKTYLLGGETEIVTVFGIGSEDGWTLNVADGVASITYPSGSLPLFVSVKGDDGLALYNEGNYVDAFKIRLIESEPLTLNASFANALLRKGYVYDASNSGDIAPETPLEADPGLSGISIDEIGSGIVGIVFNRLNENFAGGWVLGF